MRGVFFILCVCLCLNIFSQNSSGKAEIFGYVHDNITKSDLEGTKVSLMRNDSVVSSYTTSRGGLTHFGRCVWSFFIDINVNGAYFVLFEKEGYDDFVLPLSFEKPLKKGEERFVEDVPLKKTPKTNTLNEVTLKATKVKFYHKGDTLVYDATAFQTAEGSMLDALIKQLPGVELHDNGEITVNGKKIESLLLNGEPFFRGKNRVMLDNLPAYVVRNIKIYDKAGPLSIATGKDMGDKEYVMDVLLKKEYLVGWLANIEAGVGTQDRYLARAFSLRHTPLSRISLYGNLNNLNETRKPGEKSSWTPETMQAGLLSTKEFGADLLFKNKTGLYKYEGNVNLRRSDFDNMTKVSGEMFLPNGNLFTRSHSAMDRESFMLSNVNKISLWKKSRKAFLELKPEFSYKRDNLLTGTTSIDFDKNVSFKTITEILDNTYQGTLPEQGIVNLILNKDKKYDRQYDLKLGYTAFTVPSPNNQLMMSGNISFQGNENERFTQMSLNYPNYSLNNDMIYNRYGHTKPKNIFKYQNSLTFIQELPANLQARFIYDFNYEHIKAEHDFFLLEQLDGYDDVYQNIIGSLPSERELLSVIDPGNSFRQHHTSFVHTPKVMLAHQYVKKRDDAVGGGFKVLETFLTLPLSFVHDKLDYARGVYQGITKRNRVFFNPNFKTQYRVNKDVDLMFNYTLNHISPSMIYDLKIVSDENPLYVYEFGPNKLKSTVNHKTSLVYTRNNVKKGMIYTLKADYNISRNAIAMGYVYDKTTGVRTYSPDNVSGNYTAMLGFDFSSPLDKKRTVIINNKISQSAVHGIDLVGTDVDQKPIRSSVMTYWTTDRINIDYKVCNNLKVGAKGYVGYGHSTSSRKDFDNANLCDFHYGLTSLISLPWQLQVSTDLTMYCRRGYNDSGVNTNDLVWNARLSKTFAKAGFTLMVDGFDILGNLSNVSQVLNSQGRTETWRNSLPRYVIVHAIYRFNKQPKKR